MDIKHLRYFVGIAEAGSLMKAAERLSITQPALSVHLANLEEDLGVRLLERTSRGIILTEHGAAFYERAVALLQHHTESILSFRNRKGDARGSVSIGVLSTLPELIVPPLVHAMREEFPDISLYLLDASSAAVYDWLQNGKIDFAIMINFPENVGFNLTHLFVEDYCLVSRNDGSGLQDDITLESMLDRRLALPSWAIGWRKVIEERASICGKQVQVHFETESFSALRALALAGECDVILPRSSVLRECDAGLLTARRVIDLDLRGLLSLAHLNNKLMTPATTAVRDMIVRIVREARPDPEIEAATQEVRKLCPGSLFARPHPIPRMTSRSRSGR